MKYDLTILKGRVMDPETLFDATANVGVKDPYPGKLGVIEKGAYADILLVDGNPLQNLKLFDDPTKT